LYDFHNNLTTIQPFRRSAIIEGFVPPKSEIKVIAHHRMHYFTAIVVVAVTCNALFLPLRGNVFPTCDWKVKTTTDISLSDVEQRMPLSICTTSTLMILVLLRGFRTEYKKVFTEAGKVVVSLVVADVKADLNSSRHVKFVRSPPSSFCAYTLYPLLVCLRESQRWLTL
jgi:hypothetical protein